MNTTTPEAIPLFSSETTMSSSPSGGFRKKWLIISLWVSTIILIIIQCLMVLMAVIFVCRRCRGDPLKKHLYNSIIAFTILNFLFSWIPFVGPCICIVWFSLVCCGYISCVPSQVNQQLSAIKNQQSKLKKV